MTAMAKSIQTKRADGWWYPYIFVIGMAVVIVVNGVMIYFATSTFSGLSHDDYYRRGAEFNKTLDSREAMARLGWKAGFEIKAAPVGSTSRIQYLLRDASDAALAGATVTGLIVRPTHQGYDSEVTFKEADAGRYLAETSLPLPGLWEIRITATKGEDTFTIVRRFQIP